MRRYCDEGFLEAFWYQEGWDRGFEDGIHDRAKLSCSDPSIFRLPDALNNKEYHWRTGYQAGYAEGEARHFQAKLHAAVFGQPT